ncbi:unnamed protein product [marine sediment metagenome]|uniref:Uncharacterized protein n=1 Tax=marine sediment metagenome TaxID=412755 RepID=X1EY64_9ZZZZ
MNWLITKGRLMVARGMRDERGDIDIGGILIMGIGMVFLAVGFIIYPMVMTACTSLINWVCTANATAAANTTYYPINATGFTGFTPIVGIVPLLVLIGYLSAGLFAMYLGVKVVKGSGESKLDLGTLMLLGISIIFIAIGLIILPVSLDGICTVIMGGGAGISAAFVGLGAILDITPLLILISFITGAVVTGYFGIKRLSG